jgi:hypothetical protein
MLNVSNARWRRQVTENGFLLTGTTDRSCTCTAAVVRECKSSSDTMFETFLVLLTII